MCKGDGWFLVNARDVRWRESKGRGASSNFGGDTLFDQLGVGITIVGPGEPTTMYHWESNEEDFIVLRGGGVAILDGEEHRLRQWDYLHCPPGTAHITIGAGEEPCALLMAGTRAADATIRYLVEPAAAAYGASVETESTSPREVYADRPPIEPTRSPWPLS